MIKGWGELEARDQFGYTAFLWACYQGSTECMQLLADAGCDTAATSKSGKTALMLAAAEGGLKTCELLLKYGAERGFKDRWGHTAEQEAVFHQHTGPLLELLKQP